MLHGASRISANGRNSLSLILTMYHNQHFACKTVLEVRIFAPNKKPQLRGCFNVVLCYCQKANDCHYYAVQYHLTPLSKLERHYSDYYLGWIMTVLHIAYACLGIVARCDHRWASPAQKVRGNLDLKLLFLIVGLCLFNETICHLVGFPYLLF